MDRSSTLYFILSGLILGALANIPFYNWIFAMGWSWAQSFPLAWIGIGMVYMGTFFHELGHTVFLWFYGYPTLPMFDFQHGGGLALHYTDEPNMLILCLVWGALLYGMWSFRNYRALVIALIALLVLNLSLVFNAHHHDIANFMGPGAEPLIAGFFLYRALFDLAPRGAFERFLNSFFGFGLIIQVFVNAYGLLNNTAYRLVYYEQKGSHGFGDFDRISKSLNFISFEGVVWVWALLAALCFLMPVIMFLFQGHDEKIYE